MIGFLALRIIGLLQKCRLVTIQKWGPYLGRLYFYISARHRRVALANLNLVYGDSLSIKEKRNIAIKSFENLITMGLEFCHSPALGDDIYQYIHLHDIEPFYQARDSGKGIILLVPHMGNWEIIGRCIPYLSMVAHAVGRPPKQAWLAPIIHQIRIANGLQNIDKLEAMRPILSALRRKETVCLLIDQHSRTNSVDTIFMGHKAKTIASAALLAQRTGSLVLVACSYRTPEGGLGLECSPLIEVTHTDDTHADMQVNTQRFVSVIEHYVRKHPESWMWMHRRWR
jgi:KDO2-lipid IV(A) lauroyltransferase